MFNRENETNKSENVITREIISDILDYKFKHLAIGIWDVYSDNDIAGNYGEQLITVKNTVASFEYLLAKYLEEKGMSNEYTENYLRNTKTLEPMLKEEVRKKMIELADIGILESTDVRTKIVLKYTVIRYIPEYEEGTLALQLLRAKGVYDYELKAVYPPYGTESITRSKFIQALTELYRRDNDKSDLIREILFIIEKYSHFVLMDNDELDFDCSWSETVSCIHVGPTVGGTKVVISQQMFDKMKDEIDSHAEKRGLSSSIRKRIMKEFDSIVTEASAKEKKYIPYEFLRDGESVDNPFLGISENDYRTIITRMMYFVFDCMGYTNQ